MSKKENPLPQPPTSAFGRKNFEQKEQVPLMSDQIARAVAEGRLEEFIDSEMPDNEYARKLVSMMMGMTGITPPQGPAPRRAIEENEPGTSAEAESSQEGAPGEPPPTDIMRAVTEGDVREVMGLLEREHKKRAQATQQTPETDLPRSADAVPEKETIDRLVKIASENDLSLDWIILRALRLYIQEYESTRRL